MTIAGEQSAPPTEQGDSEPISYHEVFGKRPPPRELFESVVGSLEDFKAQPISVPAPPPPSEVAYSDANVRDGLNGWQDSVNQHARDSHGQPFVDSNINHSLEVQAKIEEQRRLRQRGRQAERAKVSAADAFKLGDPSSGWVEPMTCDRNFDESRPPFARLLDAAYDFFSSRGPCFLFSKRDRRHWNQIRWAMGIKAEFPGLHWPGTGPQATAYLMQSRAKRESTREIMAAYRAGEVGEICPLLKHTERAVRGFLACARREAEAVWEVSGAIRLAEIFAAFITFVVHHRALPDAFLAPAFDRALVLAQSGPRKIRESKAWETRIDQASGLNMSGFVLLCGNYYTRLQGVKAGLAWELPPEDDAAQETTAEVDDGGWGPDPNAVSVNHVDEPTAREAVSHLESVFAPLPVTSIKLWNFIPFDRRRVTAVFPPNQPSEGAPAFTTRYHRFRTVPAPWSEEEGWKGRAPHKAASDNTLDGNEHVPPGGVPFEQEKDTCPIPAELDVWVDCEGLEDFDTQCVVGMGLRARWAQIGTEEEKWWIFKLKDYVLPSFWRSTEAELEAQASDPKPPYGPMLPQHLIPKDDREREREREPREDGEGWEERQQREGEGRQDRGEANNDASAHNKPVPGDKHVVPARDNASDGTPTIPDDKHMPRPGRPTAPTQGNQPTSQSHESRETLRDIRCDSRESAPDAPGVAQEANKTECAENISQTWTQTSGASSGGNLTTGASEVNLDDADGKRSGTAEASTSGVARNAPHGDSGERSETSVRSEPRDSSRSEVIEPRETSEPREPHGPHEINESNKTRQEASTPERNTGTQLRASGSSKLDMPSVSHSSDIRSGEAHTCESEQAKSILQNDHIDQNDPTAQNKQNTSIEQAKQERPAIKAVVLGKSDPDYFSQFTSVDADDDAFDEVAGALEEEYDAEDLIAYVPEDEGWITDEEEVEEREAAHWERVLRAK